MPEDSIHVHLVDQTEFARRPVARACGNVLELAKNFRNYMDFRMEFNKVLDSNVWVMDLV